MEIDRNMKQFTLILGNPKIPADCCEVTLYKDNNYELFGKPISAKDLSKVKFNYLNWIDALMLQRDINLNGEVNILFHQDVIADLLENLNGSPYWGKDKYEALTIFNRSKSSDESEQQRINRKLAKPINPATAKTRKSRVVDAVEKLGYDRQVARDFTNQFIAQNGEKYLNLTPTELAPIIDKFIQDLVV